MPIFDVNGKAISSKKPITREIAVSSIYDKYSTYPSNGLTPERLANIFKEADIGNIYRQMELFEEMEEKDTHLFSVMQTRKNAVMGLDFDIMPFSDDPEDKKIADFVSNVFGDINSIEDIFLDLLDSIGKGIAISEIRWAYDSNRVIIEDIEWKHQKMFLYDDNNILKLVTEDAPNGMELPPNKFVIHKYKAKSGHPKRAGVLRVCSWMYLFKNYDVKDWIAFAEVYGMPLRLGKYGSNTSEEDKKALMEALVMLGSDAAGIISDTTTIEFKEANKTSSQGIYETLAAFCNAEMSKAVLGQTLTTEVGSSGSFAASKTHNEVRQDLKEADARALAQTLLRDVIRPLVFFNFGEVKRLPWIKFHYEEPDDLKAVAETYSVLVKDMRLPVATEHIYEKFGIPKPEPGQEILKIEDSAPQLPGLPLKNEMVSLKDKSKPDEFQNAIDELADNAAIEGIPMFKKMFESVYELMNRVSSIGELREKLPEVYKKMDTGELEDLIQRAMFVADMLGRMKENAASTD